MAPGRGPGRERGASWSRPLRESYVLGVVLRPAFEREEVVVTAPDRAREAAADQRPVLVDRALPRLDVEELAARPKDLVLLVAQDPLTRDHLRVLLPDVGDWLAEAPGEPPDVGFTDRRARIRAAVGRALRAVVAWLGRMREYATTPRPPQKHPSEGACRLVGALPAQTSNRG